MTSRAFSAAVLLTLVALAACDSPTAGSPLVDVRLAVDPQPIRTIAYHLPSPRAGTEEATSLLTNEIECLHTEPRECWVSDALRVTVENRGLQPVLIRERVECSQPLERFALGVWNPMSTRLCLLMGVSPIVIRPRKSEEVRVSVHRADAGTYRVRLPIESAAGLIPEAIRISHSFAYEPFPDFEPFVCPTDDRSAEAPELARMLVEQAVAGTLNRSSETEWLRLEARIPGMAYAYWDTGVRVVHLAGWAREAGSDSLARAELGPDIRIETVDFSMSELVAWFFLLGDGLGLIPGWGTLDADESRNRVRVGVASPLARSKVECVAAGIGMPEGMLLLVGGD